ncbi:prenyltransferase [Actinomadura roseirufa]|uniref:prenyltransferase n=1 Tax=Actinomadura roseirufa TaxID=2094049 RepID=UPI001040E1E1|nr:prenyltransferase [Actinomadura roseirufa]
MNHPSLTGPRLSPETEADGLLADSAADGWAQISPSPYENARVVTVAPWLAGHGRRIRHLCERQAHDGGWGVTGFRLVPTLSAVEALLTVCTRRHGPDAEVPFEPVVTAAVKGLATLRRWLDPGLRHPEATALPDTVAIEIVVPALVEMINGHLAGHVADPPSGLPDLGPATLRSPAGTDAELLATLREATVSRRALPPKAWHAWEFLAPGWSCAAEARPIEGSVGCSPAATAAWLGGRPGGPAAPGVPGTAPWPRTPAARDAGRFLNDLQEHRSGLLPLGAPMPNFERAWVLGTLAAHGVPHTAPAAMLDALDAALGEDGMAAGHGLPPDTDDTASALYALALHGRERRPDSLLRYYDGGHFCTYHDERTASPTANAHAIEALGAWLSLRPGEDGRYRPALNGAVDWLLESQSPDGRWDDKWNGSPYYATACCAQALTAYGGEGARPAVERAVGWILGTELPGGRWGHGDGTVEETAYAVLTLRLDRETPRAATVRGALSRAARTLSDGDVTEDSTPLWIGKDVYVPVRIVRASRIAALHVLNARGLPDGGH